MQLTHIVQDALSIVLEPSAQDSDKFDALQVIAEECEDLNIAQDFATLGGIPVLNTYLYCSQEEFQWRAAAILQSLTQNLERGLDIVREQRYIQRLVELLTSADSQVCHAVSPLKAPLMYC